MLELMKKIYPYLKPDLRWALWCALLSLPLAAIKAYQAYFVKNVVDGIFGPQASSALALELAVILVGLALISYPLRFIHYYGLRTIVDKSSIRMRRKIYAKFHRLPEKYFQDHKQGQMISVLINDTTVFAEAFSHAISIVREPLTAMALIGVAIYHNAYLTLAIFLALPFFLFIFHVTGKRIRKYVSLAQEEHAKMTHHASEGLSGHKIIKAFGLETFVFKKFDQSQDDFLSFKKKSNSAEEHSHPMVELVGACAFAMVILMAYYESTKGQMTVGEFFSFVGALAMFMDPVRRFSKANTKLNQARGAGERIFSFLNLVEEPKLGWSTHKISSPLMKPQKVKTHFDQKISIQNLSFSYDGEKQVLDNISLDIPKGQRVALVGASGSGKSTLLSLLLGFYNYENGSITIDDQDLNQVPLKERRAYFSLVNQDLFLFNDTVLNNIVTGHELDRERFEDVLKVCACEEFVKDLPEKENTLVGDRGVRLSGGQAQRISLARAYYERSPILLFDEATSALDNESEKIVQKAIDQASKNHTVVSVAHRLSTIMGYDCIYVFKQGKIVERGTHSELIKLGGEYKKLYDLGH